MEIYIVKQGAESLPTYSTDGSSGMDLRTSISHEIILHPLERQLISTGIAISLPAGYEAQVRSRSGLALNHGIMVLNSPGTIDSDYRGIIKVLLINLSNTPFTIKNGDRIAQLIISRYEQVTWIVVDNLDTTARGKKGYGSTGIQ